MGIPVYWSISSPVNPPKQLKPTLKRTRRPLLSSILSRSSRQQQHPAHTHVPSYSDVVRRQYRVVPRRPSTSSSEQATSPEEEARRVSETWRRERIVRRRAEGTSLASSSSGSTNVEEQDEQDEQEDTSRYSDEEGVVNYGEFLAGGEDDGMGIEGLWSDRMVVLGETGMVDEEDEEENEEDEEDERERVDEERIVSRFITRHGWAWESDIDHHLRPV